MHPETLPQNAAPLATTGGGGGIMCLVSSRALISQEGNMESEA